LTAFHPVEQGDKKAMAWVYWGTQITWLRIALTTVAELAIVGFFVVSIRLFGR
jgi:hypothetical protein